MRKGQIQEREQFFTLSTIHPGSLVLTVISAFLAFPLRASPQSPDAFSNTVAVGGTSQIVLLRRSTSQDQGAWLIDYELRYLGPSKSVVLPSEIRATVDGWISNSRLSSHTIPRFSRVLVDGTSGNSGTSDVIISSEESQRCRQRLILSVWTDNAPPPENDKLSILCLGPSSRVHARLRLEHQHVLYGEYDPLLGVEYVELTVGQTLFRDQVPLDRERYLAQPRYTWPEPPNDRLDTHHYVSAPDSLHLEAHQPGHQYYRYPECPVRYGSKLRLRFWYLVAAGTEGQCKVRLVQYKDTSTPWNSLNEGSFEEVLETVGSWTKVEHIVQARSEVTGVAVDFRIISETNIGEMWIDNVSLEPLENTGPPHMP